MNNKKSRNKGAALLFSIFGLLFCIVFFRFVYIQSTGVAAGEVLAVKAQDKYEKSRTLTAQRGSIVDSNGNVLARDTSSYTLVAILDKKMDDYVKDKEKTAAALAKHIDMEESDILERLSKKKLHQVEFGSAGRGLTHQKKNDIDKLKLPGITFRKDNKRFYPNGVFASHVLGFVEKSDEEGTSKTQTKGILGLEKELNSYLQEKDGSIKFEGDLWGNILPNKNTEVKTPTNGATVQVTLDKKIQIFLEDAMSQVNKEYNPAKMIGIVADPKTGKILAMSQRPTFDLNTREGLSSTWKNLAIEESYEPGSTMKVFTLAAAVEKGVFNPNEFYKSGVYKLKGGGQIRDHNGGAGWGTISYLEGVQRSSNVAFAKLAMEKIGPDTLLDYYKKFGLDKPTGIDLPNETNSKFVFKYQAEKVTTAFGQGTAITPIQQIQAATAIANNGKMMKPYVVDKIIDSNNGKVIKETKPTVTGTPVSSETAKEVRDILETVVTSKNGTGKPYKLKGYDVIGKTGTAQIPAPGGGYMQGYQNYIFSFLGMAPKDDPEVVIYVAVQQPNIKETETGSAPVSKVFNSVMENTLKYKNIKPDNTSKKANEQVPDLKGENAQATKQNLEDEGLNPVILGEGTTIKAQLPAAGSKIMEGERVILLTDGKIKMPDFTDWSMRDVMKAASLLDMKLNTSGSGYAVSQKPKAGTVLKKDDYIVIHFDKPGVIYNNKQNAKQDKKKSEDVQD